MLGGLAAAAAASAQRLPWLPTALHVLFSVISSEQDGSAPAQHRQQLLHDLQKGCIECLSVACQCHVHTLAPERRRKKSKGGGN